MSRKLEKSKEEIEKQLLKEHREEEALLDVVVEEKIVVSTKMPEYRRVVFVNQRDPGVMMSFHYKSKTHALKHYDLVPGVEYDLPVEVIEHVENCGYPLYGKEEMINGMQKRPVIGYKYHFAFRSPKRDDKRAYA